MKRVMIIGGSGSGKSTLARQVGARTGLPVVHMDNLFWRPGWVMDDEDAFRGRVDDAIAQDAWVMDGNYSRTWPDRLQRADTLVFLDMPTWLRLWRVIRRTLIHYGRTRPDLAPDCPERIDLGFIFGWVTQYRRTGRPRALDLVAPDGPAGHLGRHHLRGAADVRRFLAGLGPPVAPSRRGHSSERTDL